MRTGEDGIRSRVPRSADLIVVAQLARAVLAIVLPVALHRRAAPISPSGPARFSVATRSNGLSCNLSAALPATNADGPQKHTTHVTIGSDKAQVKLSAYFVDVEALLAVLALEIRGPVAPLAVAFAVATVKVPAHSQLR